MIVYLVMNIGVWQLIGDGLARMNRSSGVCGLKQNDKYNEAVLHYGLMISKIYSSYCMV